MSSLITSPNGLRRIEVMLRGKRRRIRVGHMSKADSVALQVRIDALAQAAEIGRRDVDAEKWCDGLNTLLRKRLSQAGLLPVSDDETLRGLIERFTRSRDYIKSSTAAADKQTTDALVGWFGESCIVRSITPVKAQEWRDSLVKEYAEATISKRISKARGLFKKAVKWGFTSVNPFEDVRAGDQTNESRQFFVTQETAQAVLAACPDAEWRAIFALARWGGVRIPSEIANLTWGDVLWDSSRFRVRSPKTEHHRGKSERWTPLFPEVYTALRELFEQAPAGTEFVFQPIRRQASNLRTSMEKIIGRAGVTVWPKLFQNLRSSRETELVELYPLHVVCGWLGNSPAVAKKHYLQMLDPYFAKAAQKQAQQACAETRTVEREPGEMAEKPHGNAVAGGANGRYRTRILRERLQDVLKKHATGAKSGAFNNAIVDAISDDLISDICALVESLLTEIEVDHAK